VSYPELYPSGPGMPGVSAAELEAAVFHVGRAVWREALTLGVRAEVMEDLDDALEVYHAILSGPERSPERRAEALSRAAGHILRWTAELIRQAPAAAERAA
jgi:hypothetical protein